jgi:hypothetical protein
MVPSARSRAYLNRLRKQLKASAKFDLARALHALRDQPIGLARNLITRLRIKQRFLGLRHLRLPRVRLKGGRNRRSLIVGCRCIRLRMRTDI